MRHVSPLESAHRQGPASGVVRRLGPLVCERRRRGWLLLLAIAVVLAPSSRTPKVVAAPPAVLAQAGKVSPADRTSADSEQPVPDDAAPSRDRPSTAAGAPESRQSQSAPSQPGESQRDVSPDSQPVGSQPLDEPPADEPDEARSAVIGPRRVAARVGDDVIFVDEVDQSLAAALAGRQVSPELRAELRAATLRRLIERRLIEHFLVSIGLGPTDDEVDAEAARMLQQLEQQGHTLDEWLRASGLSSEALRQRLRWRLAWRKGFPIYIAQQRSDERLERYFREHQPEFDGTTIRVRHILLRTDTPRDRAAIERATQQAERIRQRILAGELDFAEAARRYSSGPSAARGGDLGYFPRFGEMVEPFAEAAFALADGEISPPVSTPFGVHLIQRLDTRAGARDFQEFLGTMTPIERKRFYNGVDRQIYDELVAQLRRSEPIELAEEFAAAWPPAAESGEEKPPSSAATQPAEGAVRQGP